MLKKVRARKISGKVGRIAIVASKYNTRYVDGMLRAAKVELQKAGVERVDVIRVPGAYEVPVVAAKLASGVTGEVNAIICLGVILRGETTHADHIGIAVSHALAEVQVRTGVPVIHEVLLFENEDQAKVRCLSKDHNRGREAALTALEMAQVMAKLK